MEHKVELTKHPEQHWTAARVKPRTEKVVEEYCRRHGLVCYLPLRRRVQRYQRRTVVTFLPMFAGYVFVRLGDEQKTVALGSHKILHFLQVNGRAEDTLLSELNEIQRLEHAQTEAEVVVEPGLVSGRPVLITGGPLRGLRGIVQNRHHAVRVTLNVEILGQAASVELDVSEVEVEPD